MRLHSVYWLYVYPPRGCDTRKNETLFLFSSLNPRHDANRAPPTSRSARSTNDQFEGPHRGSNCDFTARERGELTHTACTRLAQLVHSSYLSLCFYVHMRDVYVDKFATTSIPVALPRYPRYNSATTLLRGSNFRPHLAQEGKMNHATRLIFLCSPAFSLGTDANQYRRFYKVSNGAL